MAAHDDETAVDEEPADVHEEPAAAEPIVLGAADDETPDRTDDVAEEPAAARPTAADDLTVDRLIYPADAERFNGEWRDVKAGVDDPSAALQHASDLSTQVLDELTASLGRLRQKLDDHWHEGEDSDTERLRIALRGYGSLIDRILST